MPRKTLALIAGLVIITIVLFLIAIKGNASAHYGNVPTPTPTPTPIKCDKDHHWNNDERCVTPTPTPTIKPCFVWINEHIVNCPTPTPTVTPTITPTPSATPSATPTPTSTPSGTGNTPAGNASTTQAPVCGDGSTIQLPANSFVIRTGTHAVVNFFITQGDRANIYVRVTGQSDWNNAITSVIGVKPNADHFVSITINDLDANTGYDFGIQQVQGCGGGQLITAVVVDGPQSRVFNFSYWEWSK